MTTEDTPGTVFDILLSCPQCSDNQSPPCGRVNADNSGVYLCAEGPALRTSFVDRVLGVPKNHVAVLQALQTLRDEFGEQHPYVRFITDADSARKIAGGLFPQHKAALETINFEGCQGVRLSATDCEKIPR